MYYKKIIWCILVYAFLFSPAVLGGDQMLTGLFVLEDMSARPASLGGAFGAVSGDANVIKYNPAGLADLPQYEFIFSHVVNVEDISYESLQVGIPFAKHGAAIGLSFDYAQYGDLKKTDELGNIQGSFSARDSVFNMAVSKQFSTAVLLGATVKFFSSKYEQASRAATIYDIGGLYRHKNMSFGAAVQNMGDNIRFIDVEENLPFNIRFSFSYEPFVTINPPTMYADVNIVRGENVTFNAGFEFWFNEAIGVRTGYRDQYDEGKITAGFGARGRVFQLDYAYGFGRKMSSSHRISATFRMGGSEKEGAYTQRLKKYKKFYFPQEEVSERHMRKFHLDAKTGGAQIILLPPAKTVK